VNRKKETWVIGELIMRGKYGVNVFCGQVSKSEESKLKKEAGRYVTVNCSPMIHTSHQALRYVSNILSKQISSFLISKTVLVVGLGNAFMIADSLGSRVIQDLLVTHEMHDFVRSGLADVSALISGVSGINGFPTSNLVKSVVELIKPKQVIVIDTFTTQSVDRVGCSFQLSNTGITAGAGLGRKNQSLNSHFLGVPVLSVGVPLMLNVDTIGMKDYVMAPKEIDILCKNCAKIVARALNFSLHGEKYLLYI